MAGRVRNTIPASGMTPPTYYGFEAPGRLTPDNVRGHVRRMEAVGLIAGGGASPRPHDLMDKQAQTLNLLLSNRGPYERPRRY